MGFLILEYAKGAYSSLYPTCFAHSALSQHRSPSSVPTPSIMTSTGPECLPEGLPREVAVSLTPSLPNPGRLVSGTNFRECLVLVSLVPGAW